MEVVIVRWDRPTLWTSIFIVALQQYFKLTILFCYVILWPIKWGFTQLDYIYSFGLTPNNGGIVKGHPRLYLHLFVRSSPDSWQQLQYSNPWRELATTDVRTKQVGCGYRLKYANPLFSFLVLFTVYFFYF